MKKIFITFSVVAITIVIVIVSYALFYGYYDGPDLESLDSVKLKSELDAIHQDITIPNGPVQVDSGYLDSISFRSISKSESSISISMWRFSTKEKGFLLWKNDSYGKKYSGGLLDHTKIDDRFYSYYTWDWTVYESV